MMWSMVDPGRRVGSLARGYVLFLCHASNVSCQSHIGFFQRCDISSLLLVSQYHCFRCQIRKLGA